MRIGRWWWPRLLAGAVAVLAQWADVGRAVRARGERLGSVDLRRSLLWFEVRNERERGGSWAKRSGRAGGCGKRGLGGGAHARCWAGRRLASN
jgi:hypothetical protein